MQCPLGSWVGRKITELEFSTEPGNSQLEEPTSPGSRFRGSAALSPTEVQELELCAGSELNHPGDGRIAEQRPFRRKWISELPRAVPPTSRPSSGGSAAAMEPAGLELILRELLLPDTERIRRVRGRRGRTGKREVAGKA